MRQLDQAGIKAVDVGIRRPTLDEVFLTLTGKPTTDAEPASANRDEETIR